MKKVRVILAVLFSFILLMTAAACGESLSAPQGIDIDEELLLTWNAVEGARTYRLEIRSLATGGISSDTARVAHYDLSGLAEGDYELRIMAVGGSRNEEILSPWSETVNFHKNYETGLLYELINNNTEYRIRRVGTANGTVSIEDVYRNRPVTEIGEAAFRASSKVENVKIGGNVRTIGVNAFYNCTGLKSVVIPESVVYLGEAAFQGCSALTEVAVPGGISEIPERAFAYCRALTHVQLSEGIAAIGESAFYACSALKEIAIPSTVSEIGEYAFSTDNSLESVSFGSGLETISERAFYSCPALENISFASPDGELRIGDSAFRSTAIASIELPEGVSEIGDYAFYASEPLDSAELPESLTSIGLSCFNGTALYRRQTAEGTDGFVYADDWLVAVTATVRAEITALDPSSLREGTRGIASNVFYNAPNLEAIELPASVKYIGAQSFYHNVKLFRFISPEEGLISIGDGAFSYCEFLSNFRFGRGLREIGNYAFYHCSMVGNNALGTSIIPDTVTRIGTNAFVDTTLWNDPREDGVIYAGDWIVGYAEDSLSGTVQIDENARGIADYAFSNANALTNVIGLNSIRFIGEGAFSLCSNLSAAGLSRSLTEIKPFTFYKCSALYRIDLPMGLTSIGDYAFYVCDRLSALDLSGTRVESVGSHAFYECTNIKTLSLGSSLSEIADYAFYHCYLVTEVTVPGSVKRIGERAFGKCTSLTDVHIEEGVEEIGAFAFRECAALEDISFPDSLVSIEQYAFYSCAGLREISFGSGLTRIEKYAFFGTDVRSLCFPADLGYIGDAAFKNCSALTAVTFLGPVGYIGAHAFYAPSEYGMAGGLSFYVAGALPGGWSGSWNSAYRPVIQSCEFTEEGCLVSLTVGEGTIQNGHVWGGLSAPVRRGYTFAGWATEEDALEPEYSLNELPGIAAGTKLYAVWREGEPIPPSGEETVPQPPNADENTSVQEIA